MFTLTAETPIRPVEKRTLIIAMTARVGSTHLCSVLAKLGPFGEPLEAFNARGPNTPLAVASRRLDGPDAYLEQLAASEIVCFKAAWIDWAVMAPRARDVFPNAAYVYLHRLDTDAQARSLACAKQSGIWHRRAGEPPAPKVDIDMAELARCRADIEVERMAWRRFFSEQAISPLSIAYEHMCADMGKAVAMICAHVGIDAPASVPEGDMAVLRGA